jgi:hypothetical protein
MIFHVPGWIKDGIGLRQTSLILIYFFLNYHSQLVDHFYPEDNLLVQTDVRVAQEVSRIVVHS